MDCCGSNKSKEKDEDIKEDKQEAQTSIEKNPTEKSQATGGGCCGGGTKDMVLHLVIMIVVFLIVSYFLRS